MIIDASEYKLTRKPDTNKWKTCIYCDFVLIQNICFETYS